MKDFVDRRSEIDQYGRIASRRDNRRIFWLQAEDGWGKSWLLARLYLEALENDCLKAIIDLGNTRVKDEESLLECIAEEMRGSVSEEMIKAISTPLGNIHIQAGRDVNIEGDVVVNKVVVNHQGGTDHLSVELRDSHGYNQRVNNLTRLFETGLEQLQPPTGAILFLDRFEKATEPTRNWLIDRLFTGMRDGAYTNLIVIVSSSQPFDLFKGREWRDTMALHEIKGLPEESIREYWLQKRSLSETHMNTILILLREKGNSPFELSTLADIFERSPNGK